MSREESYARASLFDEMVPGILNPEMIEETAKIVNEAVKDKVQVNLIINNRAGGNAPLIAQKLADRFHSEKQHNEIFRQNYGDEPFSFFISHTIEKNISSTSCYPRSNLF
jgi:hypothetical protein